MIIFGKYGKAIEKYSWSPKKSLYVKWAPGDEDSDFLIFLDEDIMDGLHKDFNVPKIAWIRESKTIMPSFYNLIEKNIDEIKNNYKYILSHDKYLVDTYNLTYCLPNAAAWITETNIPHKTKLVSMFNSGLNLCEEHSKRNDFMEKFKNNVDVYGRLINPIKTKEEGLLDYMFSITVENARYAGHFSEKLTDCFASKTIPVYWGGTAKDFDQFFDPDGVIFLDDSFDIGSLTEDLYYSKIDIVEKNYQLALDFPTPEDWIAKNILSMENNDRL